MSDLISRKAAIEAMNTWDWQELYLPIHFKQLLEELPSAEKTGRWIQDDIAKALGIWLCSECMLPINLTDEHGVFQKANYCPLCGARMEAGQLDER